MTGLGSTEQPCHGAALKKCPPVPPWPCLCELPPWTCLCELRLAISPEALVAVASGQLEVLVHPPSHQELLVLLGALGQGIELPRARAGHDKLPGTLVQGEGVLWEGRALQEGRVHWNGIQMPWNPGMCAHLRGALEEGWGLHLHGEVCMGEPTHALSLGPLLPSQPFLPPCSPSCPIWGSSVNPSPCRNCRTHSDASDRIWSRCCMTSLLGGFGVAGHRCCKDQG